MLQRLFGACGDFRLGRLAHAQRDGDVLEDRQVRPAGKCLKHHAGIAIFEGYVEIFTRRRRQFAADMEGWKGAVRFNPDGLFSPAPWHC